MSDCFDELDRSVAFSSLMKPPSEATVAILDLLISRQRASDTTIETAVDNCCQATYKDRFVDEEIEEVVTRKPQPHADGVDDILLTNLGRIEDGTLCDCGACLFIVRSKRTGQFLNLCLNSLNLLKRRSVRHCNMVFPPEICYGECLENFRDDGTWASTGHNRMKLLDILVPARGVKCMGFISQLEVGRFTYDTTSNKIIDNLGDGEWHSDWPPEEIPWPPATEP
jgi:hypothetical protein